MNDNPKIKHLVLAGGGVCGFSIYGALKASHEDGFWNMANIESIYGTSVGAIFATIISLKYDWQTVDDYLIKRPWQTVFKFDMYSIINSIQNRGIFTIKTIEEVFLPLFKGKDIDIGITMSGLYELTGIELHFYTTVLETFDLVDISYKTHPDWKVVDAVYCSCSLPIVFAPFVYVSNLPQCNSTWYFDGGMLCNYPIHQCLADHPNVDEILGLSQNVCRAEEPANDLSLFDYLFMIINRMIKRVDMVTELPGIKEIKIHSSGISIYELYLAASTADERIRLIELGAQNWEIFRASVPLLKEEEEEPLLAETTYVSIDSKEEEQKI